MRFACVGLALFATSALAEDVPADRLQPVIAARLELQRSLRADLEGALSSIVAPYRVLVTVEATMSARLRENVRSEETPGTEVHVKPMRQVELPGLPVVRQQMVGAGTPQMEYRVPGRKVTEKTSTVDAEVQRLTVRVFLDEGVPDALREEVKRIVVALTGLDTAKGDVLELSNLPLPVEKSLLQHTPPAWLYGLLALLAALVGSLFVGLLLALGVGRRGGDAAGTGGSDSTVRVVAGEAAVGGAAPGEPGASPAAVAALAAGPFAALADATAEELVAVTADLSDTDAASLLAALSVDQGAARRAFALLPPARQLTLGRWMGTSHVVQREELERIAASAREKLDVVRSRVALGGADQLSDLLLEAPEETLKSLLDELGKRDAPLAEALRQRMPLFDDLATLEAPAMRAVVTQVDPSVLAVALASAPVALREAVYQSVSKRLRAILESEGEGLASAPSDETAAARRRVELVMRRLRVQKRGAKPAAAA